MAKDEQQTQTQASETEQPKEPEVFDNSKITPVKVMNFDYVNKEAEEVRADLTEFVEALKPKTKVHVLTRDNNQHDLRVLQEGRTVLRVCPLRASYSASLPADKGAIKSHSKKVILAAISKME